MFDWVWLQWGIAIRGCGKQCEALLPAPPDRNCIANSWKGGKLKWFLANYKKIDGQRQTCVKNIWVWIFDKKNPVNLQFWHKNQWNEFEFEFLTWKIKKIYLNLQFWQEKSRKLIWSCDLIQNFVFLTRKIRLIDSIFAILKNQGN